MEITEELKNKYAKEWLTVDEVKKIEENVTFSTRNILLFQITYYSALRISEALNLRVEDLIEEKSHYYLILRQQKTDKVNIEKQPVPKDIYIKTMRYIKDENLYRTNYIFGSRNFRLSRSWTYRIFQDMVDKAGINKKIGTHTLRRSRGSHLLDSGMDSFVVMHFMRHKSLRMLMAYLKVSKDLLYEKMAVIDSKNKEVVN